MKTKLKLFTMIVLAMGVLQATAQQGDHKPPSIEKRVKGVTKLIEEKMKLSDNEIEVIQNAYTDFFKTTDKLMKSGQRPEKPVMEKYEGERDAKIRKILSKDEYEQYLEISSILRPKHHKKGDH